MPKIILLHAAYLGKGAEAKLVAPGDKAIPVSAAQAKELVALGAARLADAAEATTKEAEKAPGGEAPGGGGDGDTDLDGDGNGDTQS